MSPTNLDLDTLRTLVTAEELRGYGRAAERLGRTPSAVSLQMKRLQDDVGARLFRKSGLVSKTRYTANGCMAILGGEQASKDSFFVVVRSDEPVTVD